MALGSRMADAITPRTRVIAFSWVQFQTGSITDLASLVRAARERQIWTVVDVIQGLGQLPFDFQASGIDAACGGSHKWMVSPVGVGFLALREEHIQKLRPLSVGSATYGSCEDPASLACSPKKQPRVLNQAQKRCLTLLRWEPLATF